MAFTGDLEHLPIVDLIQLMNSTRKTGVLTVAGRKGKSQLVFKDGYIVSANHLDNSVRIGQVLVDRGLITAEQLQQGLAQQKQDGAERKPLAITLIEMGVLQEADATKGLQYLIEMTVVEILTWKKGRFTLDYLTDVVDSDFKYYPERMNHEVNVNTQSILMEALRIFDEKMRDGLIEAEPEDISSGFVPTGAAISADLLGLSEIDLLAEALPQAFSAVEPTDPLTLQRNRLQEIAPQLSLADSERLARFLVGRRAAVNATAAGTQIASELLLASSDALLEHLLAVVTDGTETRFHLLGKCGDVKELVVVAINGGRPVMAVFDAPVMALKPAWEDLQALRDALCGSFPALATIQLVTAEPPAFYLAAYRHGVRAVIPRPDAGARPASYAEELISLVEYLFPG